MKVRIGPALPLLLVALKYLLPGRAFLLLLVLTFVQAHRLSPRTLSARSVHHRLLCGHTLVKSMRVVCAALDQGLSAGLLAGSNTEGAHDSSSLTWPSFHQARYETTSACCRNNKVAP